jgi:hypothetical protein
MMHDILLDVDVVCRYLLSRRALLAHMSLEKVCATCISSRGRLLDVSPRPIISIGRLYSRRIHLGCGFPSRLCGRSEYGYRAECPDTTDERGGSYLPERGSTLCLLTTSYHQCQHAALIGDHKQLPPLVISQKAEQGKLQTSLFERLIVGNSKLNRPVLTIYPDLRVAP